MDFNSNAYLQMKVSKVWFKTNSDEVRSILPGWIINKNDCDNSRNNLEKISGFSIDEVDFVCKSLGEDNLKSFVKKSLKDQIIIVLLMITVAIAIAFTNLFLAKTANEALLLKKRLSST